MGGGTSALVDRLIEDGYAVSVLDISEAALARARERLGPAAAKVRWLAGDVTRIADLASCDVWHDRAVFHFLTDALDRRKYIALLERTVTSGGHAVIATFAPDGPERCSGLEVCRYSSESLRLEIGSGFRLVRFEPETHLTPWGKPQAFQYSLLRRC